MKKSIKPFILLISILGFMAIARIGTAQPAPPPPDVKGSSENKGPSDGGGAPIDGGVIVSLAMVAGYGAWKLLKIAKRKTEAV